MAEKLYTLAYLTQEGGRPVLKIGQMMFLENGKPVIVAKHLPNGEKLCVPIPDAAIPRLQKTNITLDYIFPDGIAFPPDKPPQMSSN